MVVLDHAASNHPEISFKLASPFYPEFKCCAMNNLKKPPKEEIHAGYCISR
jgi:hypothetical protein